MPAVTATREVVETRQVSTDPTETATVTATRTATLTEAVSRTAAQVADLTTDITSGRVTLDPEAGERLITALRAQADDVDGWLGRVGRMTSPLPLGANMVGNAMAGKFSGRADGEQTSFAAVLGTYRTVLDAALSAVTRAVGSYRDAENTNSDRYRTIERNA